MRLFFVFFLLCLTIPAKAQVSFVACAYNPNDHTHLYVYQTEDGQTFSAPSGVTNPVYQFDGGGGAGVTIDTQACSMLYDVGQRKYFVAYEYNDEIGTGSLQTSFGIASSPLLNGPWTFFTDVQVFPSCNVQCYVWNPSWFVDDDGSVHIYVNAQNGGTYDAAMQPYILDAQNAIFTSWSTPTAITGTFAGNMIDTDILSKNNSPNGKYNIWYKNENTHCIEYMTSSSLKSGYTTTQSGDWNGWGCTWEGTRVRLFGSQWRLYVSPIGQAPWEFSTSPASSNWAANSWSAMTQTTSITPMASGDFLNQVNDAHSYLIFPSQSACMTRSHQMAVAMGVPANGVTQSWWDCSTALNAGTIGSTAVPAGSYAMRINPSGMFGTMTSNLVSNGAQGLTTQEQSSLATAAQIAPLISSAGSSPPSGTTQAVP